MNEKQAVSPFIKVKDSRGHDVRGLWERNGRFYLQMRVPGKTSQSKVPLADKDGNPVATVPQARDAMNELLKQRKENCLPVLTKTPTFSEWVESYIGWLQKTEAKHPLTIDKEAQTLAKWTKRLGTVRLSQIRRAHVNEFLAWRKEESKVGPRTLNLDIIALNNCLKHAIQEGRLQRLPTENWAPLAAVAPKRPLWTPEQIDAVCAAALKDGNNGDLLADYIRFMAYSGARRNEALNVAWSDVDDERRIVHIRKTKYSHERTVDFNAKLETHLKEMRGRRVPGVEWLFPSPSNAQGASEAARNLQGSLEAARSAVGLPDFCFHDLRHFFISTCVMAGIDFMTIARWVGHKDGGILIGKVYGHLNDEHAKKQAGRVFAAEAPKAPEPAAGDVLKLLQQLQAQVTSLQTAKAA